MLICTKIDIEDQIISFKYYCSPTALCSKITIEFCALYILNIQKLVAPFDTPTLNLNLINVWIIGKIRLYVTFSRHCNCR